MPGAHAGARPSSLSSLSLGSRGSEGSFTRGAGLSGGSDGSLSAVWNYVLALAAADGRLARVVADVGQFAATAGIASGAQAELQAVLGSPLPFDEDDEDDNGDGGRAGNGSNTAADFLAAADRKH